MIRDNREYRNLGALEARQEEDNYIVEGYASTFDAYPLFTEDGVTFYEKIEPTAFNFADMSDVVFLRDHEGRVLARTKNDSVKLSIDDHGLKVRANLGLTGASKEMYEDISVGNYTQMSFAFTIEDDYIDDKTNTRVITRMKKLFDVSAVAFPANPFTDIGVSARDRFNGVIEARRLEMAKKARIEEIRKRTLLKLKIEGVENHGN